MKKIFAGIVAAVLFSAAAYAQSSGTVASHAFAIGKGPGVTGYTSALCTSAQLAVGQAAADPICRTITGDWTLNAAGVSALATVNANVGSFGSATQCTVFTVNAKGLITAASQTACIVTTNANLTGPVTSVGNATTIGANQVTRANEAQGVARSVVGVAGNATANVADIQGTANQFFGVNSGGTALAFQTMSGDCTLAGAVITCAKTSLPYFSASLSASQTVTSGTFTKMAANTVLVDSNSWYDGVTNFRYTPLQAGKYRVSGSCEGLGTTVTEVDSEIRKNGTPYARNLSLASGVATSSTIDITVIANGSTDFFELFCDVTGTGTTQIVGGSAPIRSWFEARYVGQ